MNKMIAMRCIRHVIGKHRVKGSSESLHRADWIGHISADINLPRHFDLCGAEIGLNALVQASFKAISDGSPALMDLLKYSSKAVSDD